MMETGALFSPCRTFRYQLWREWSDGDGTCTFIMLNPSTADETVNDPTVERCQRRAAMLGFSRLIVVNLFALRSTDPNALYKAADPIGPQNDDAILDAAKRSQMVICAWGKHGGLMKRAAAVRATLSKEGVVAHHLGLTKDGEPKHPLYIGYSVQPKPLS